MYTIFNIKFDIPKQIFFLSYNNDENRDLKNIYQDQALV